MLRFPILNCKGMRPMMFQLSGFYCRVYTGPWTATDHEYVIVAESR